MERKYVHKYCQSDGIENYLHDTTHCKSLCCASNIVQNFNLCVEENSFLIWIVLCWDIWLLLQGFVNLSDNILNAI